MPESPVPESPVPERRAWIRLERDVIAVSGPEAEVYLQGQLSQDLGSVPPGRSAWSWLLAPTGKVDALLRISRSGDGDWLLDTDAGWGEAVLTRLRRFKLRTRADIEAYPAAVLALRGDGWDLDSLRETAAGGKAVVSSPPWPAVAGADVIVPNMPGAVAPDLSRAAELSPVEYEALRIRAAKPRMGAELGEKTIPGETGLVPWTVSFTKGCYTGQELVARVDSRGGNVPRHLCRFLLDAEVPAGTALFDGEREGGIVTSVAPSPGGPAGWVGLGYLRRGIEHPAVLSAGPGGPPVRTETLPW